MTTMSRRSFLELAAGAGAAAGLGQATLGAVAARAAGLPELKHTYVAPGFSAMITLYLAAKKFDEKNGISLKLGDPQSSLTTYYADLVAGNVDLGMGSWDVFASRYLAGVPLQLVCVFTTADMIHMMAGPNGPKSVKELAGRSLAAPVSTGTYRMVRAMLKEFHGIDLEKVARVQNVDNMAMPGTLLLADRADAGLSWEPNISRPLKADPKLRIIYSAGADYRAHTGHAMPYFAVAVRKDALGKGQDIAARIAKSFEDTCASFMANVDEAIASVPEKILGIDPDVIKLAIGSGRLAFKSVSMADPAGRASVLAASEFMARNGLLPRKLDEGFFPFG